MVQIFHSFLEVGGSAVAERLASWQRPVTQILALCAVTVSGILPVLAHENDPKNLSTEPAYRGPGWRQGQGGLAGGFASSNVALRSWVPLDELHSGSNRGNDCTGYVSPSGREYAIIGTDQGTGFVEITDPTDPTVLQFRSGPTSTWRDMKVFGEYAYIVSEGGGGIQCFDLREIDSGVVPEPASVITGGTLSTHNVAINVESGFLYRCGGGSNHGLRIYDLNADPLTPPFVGEWMDRYVHDVQVVSYLDGPFAGREIAFCCSGFNNGGTDTGLDVVDVTDKANPIVLRRITYPGAAYSHQGWLTPDRKYFLLGDELDEGGLVDYSSLIIINVENIALPFYVTTWDNGNEAITHNIYTRGDLAYMANYTSGLRIFDIRDALSPREVGYIDTFPTSDNRSFDGLWGCYADFPSGTVIGSDIQRGLFVVTPEIAEIRFFPVGGVPTLIGSTAQEILFDVDPLETEVDPDRFFMSYDDGTGLQEVAAEYLGDSRFRVITFGLQCPGELSFQFGGYDTDGELYRSEMFSTIIADEFPTVFADDFEQNLPWLVSGSATSVSNGRWMHGFPVGDGIGGDPLTDFDGSGRCYLTGNGPGYLDVDGEAILTSPVMDATEGVAYVSYARWFNNSAGPWAGQDSMYVELSGDDGQSWVQMEEVGPTGEEASGGWYVRLFRVNEFVVPTETVRVRFRALDTGPDSLVEAAIDSVKLEIIVCSEEVFGDLNGDGFVDGADLAILLGSWGASNPDIDLNGDGVITGADLTLLLGVWTL